VQSEIAKSLYYTDELREISKIADGLLVEINKIAIEEGIEGLNKFREDSTVVETNIHYPTNNSLLYDCIKESHRLLTHLQKEINTLEFENYLKEGKKTYAKINFAKTEDKRVDLFLKQFGLFVKSINQVSNVIKKS
jgi:IS5 family transposase